MQPTAIKHKAKQRNPKIKMSANNVRDVIKLFRQKRIVKPVKLGKKSHLRYELTELGHKMQGLLSQAEISF